MRGIYIVDNYVICAVKKGGKMKRKYKLTILFVLVILLMVSSVFSVLHLRVFKENDFTEMAEQITNQTASIFELWITDQIRMAKLIAQNEDVIRLCIDPANPEVRARAGKFLNQLQADYPYYENLPIASCKDTPFVLELEDESYEINCGEFIIDTANNTTIGEGGEEYSYISNVKNGKEYYISEIYNSITRGDPIFVISVPVIKNEEIIGVAIVSPKMNYLTEFFVDSISIADTGYMFVVDGDSKTIAHKNRNFILNEVNDNKEVVEHITRQIDEGNNFFEANIFETSKFYYGLRIDLPSDYIEHNLYVVITQNKVEVFRQVHFFAFISVMIAFLIAYLTYKSIILINNNQLHQEKELQLIALNLKLEEKVKDRTKELEELAKRDGMTGLYNHEHINQFLIELLSRCDKSKLLVVAILDIDDFKKVNDRFGHQTGDVVIKTVATILQSTIRQTDMVGRYGGEEFLVILNDTDYDQCIQIVERIRTEILATKFTNIGYSVTVSIGVTPYRCESPEDLIKRADSLMYKAKSNGKNQVVHDFSRE